MDLAEIRPFRICLKQLRIKILERNLRTGPFWGLVPSQRKIVQFSKYAPYVIARAAGSWQSVPS